MFPQLSTVRCEWWCIRWLANILRVSPQNANSARQRVDPSVRYSGDKSLLPYGT